MFKTYGLSHVALAVRDVTRSVNFYQQIFGATVMYKQEGFAQIQTPGTNDIIVFEENKIEAGKPGGILHFGFRLENPNDIELVRKAVETTGTTIKDQGEFIPGEPYIFFLDPDGYEVEVWYEKQD